MNAGRYLMRRGAVAASGRGMTLIEIMVVIAIIGIVMTAVGVGVVPQLNKARIKAAAAQLNTIENALVTYTLDAETPNSLEALTKGAGAVLKVKQLKDPWGVPFVYTYPSQDNEREYDICSNGPDKKPSTDDDICNYEK
jgi:general secretion pathway protein G